MPLNDIDYEELTKSLAENFILLADEVQLLSDRKTILEHKLRFAHEQYQRLADKYAQGDAEISSTLAKLQLSQDSQVTTPDRAGFVPLPRHGQSLSKQQTAVAIRDGRRAAQRLSQVNGLSVGSTASGRSVSAVSSNLRHSAKPTSLSTVLEQDFTVPGKRGSLHCPFSRPTALQPTKYGTMKPQTPSASGTQGSDQPLSPRHGKDTSTHHGTDPICAALYAETTASGPPSAAGSAAKCPIRFLDQHSPEEVAAYFETHKHEIPRSHEVCVRRYQRNEADIAKLDAKYGNLVNMIQGLGQKHQSMLATKEDEDFMELEHASNERVENWAQAISGDGIDLDHLDAPGDPESDRESRFDRPMKEVRVGESPSRPWGISVPIFDLPADQVPRSPSPAPVSANHLPKPTIGKCPFGHGQQQTQPVASEQKPSAGGKCPFGHGQGQTIKTEERLSTPSPIQRREEPSPFMTNVKAEEQKHVPNYQSQPAFIQPQPGYGGVGNGPQMIFTGPVFIGYPIEQAMAFMQQYKGT